MSEENKNLTPWQEKNQEYKRQKAIEEATVTPNPAKKSKRSSKVEETEKKALENEFETEEDIFNDERENEAEVAFNKFKSENEFIVAEEEEQVPRFSYLPSLLNQMKFVLIIAVLIFLGAIYAVSPLSKIGNFSVSGNQHESSQQIAAASELKTGDNVFKILRERRAVEQRIEQNFPRIASVQLKFQFPNHFKAAVVEHLPSVYVQQNNKTYLVLDNGYILKNQVINPSQLQKIPMLKNFTDSEVKTFVTAFEQLKPSLQSLITTVTKTPTAATKDFIALDMSDGNQVRVPLNEMSEKLPYYPSVAKQVKAPQVVDMEAGIYTKPKDAYLQELASESASAKKSSAAQNSTTTTTAK
ncbi:cell division protein FtsQ/DivIB [Lactococcus nasutitermitis]|uniref:Cell division protein DivIB n=1 Tax=Lactococcus nasutitermitis TaxID=1652957 RepID=A0ABV9JA84_9LACT|nr:FtsQ-type POTRA domain-containing protein [Lactococcus nasutitermitis]